MKYRRILSLFSLCCAIGCSSPEKPVNSADAGNDHAHDDGTSADATVTATTTTLRVATYNVSLFRRSAGELVDDLRGGEDAQARSIAEVLQRARPDVVLLNEFDWDAAGEAAQLFTDEYLAVSQNGAEPLSLDFHFVPETNTGQPSGVDLNGDGAVATEEGSQAYGDDAFGFGQYRGQYGMVVYSRYPIATDNVRTFRELLWRDVPNSLLPTDWYSPAAVEVFRLSSKNHIDVPITVGEHTLHVLGSHPTPPSFDGPEDRNGRRNHDEIRFWVDYIEQADYIRDDDGGSGGLSGDANFVVLGDLNSDPVDAESERGALLELLAHARVQDPAPESEGATEAAAADGQANGRHSGDPKLDTADFSDGVVGNLRVDYALPSSNMSVTSSGVFWPLAADEHSEIASASDHHLVWVDVVIGAALPR